MASPSTASPQGKPLALEWDRFCQAAIVTCLLGPIPMILGFIGWGRAQRTGKAGKGLAIAGMIIGMISMVFWMAFIIASLHIWTSVNMQGPVAP